VTKPEDLSLRLTCEGVAVTRATATMRAGVT
jgi:hypothetical protein